MEQRNFNYSWYTIMVFQRANVSIFICVLSCSIGKTTSTRHVKEISMSAGLNTDFLYHSESFSKFDDGFLSL